MPVATSYPHIVLIEGVGDSQTLEIGGLGGDLGGFGIANEDVRMFGGGTCDSELWLTAPRVRAVLGVLTMFRSPLEPCLAILSVDRIHPLLLLCFAWSDPRAELGARAHSLTGFSCRFRI